MTPELQKYYENYFDLFATPGYRQWIEEIAEHRTDISNIMTIQDSNELFRRKGQLETLDRILNFKELIERSYKEHTEDEDFT